MTTADRQTIVIRPEPTPNPASVRFVASCAVLEGGTADIKDAASARERSPLAARLFGLAAVNGVFLGANFVTVSAEPGVDWNSLAASVIDILRGHLSAGEPVLIGEPDAAPAGAHDQSEVAQGVMRIIDAEIRPAVAMDGGDVVFDSYQGGIVYLQLRGSCHGCPSSLMTLKMGIERRLQEEFPEIVAVEAV
jgi:Fe-S cluster biogenesis protein NfuA